MRLSDRRRECWAGVAVVLGSLMLGSAPGCGINPNLTAEQQDREAKVKMAWLDRAIDVAEKHALAYRVELNASGRPSIGEKVDFYLDTGLEARIIMFGNGASGREPVELNGGQ